VCTVALGDAPYVGVRHPLMERYAERLGAAFLRVEGPYEGRRSNLRKLELGRFLEDYDRVLYLDGDVAVRPDAPDLFDLVPADRLGAWLEGEPYYEERGRLLAEACGRYGVPAPRADSWVNTGVMVLSRAHRALFDPAPAGARALGSYMDMPLLNARIVERDVSIEPLHVRFNFPGTLARMAARPFNAYDAYCFHATGGLGRARMPYLRAVVDAWERGLHERARARLAVQFALRAGWARTRRWRPLRAARRRVRNAIAARRAARRGGGPSPTSSSTS